MNTNYGQAEPSKDWDILELCCLSVAKKLNKGDYQNWKNSDYIDLRAQIRRATKVHISENTLKRIFGKLKTPDQYTPQKATRDALAAYIGYADWVDFEMRESDRRGDTKTTIIYPANTDASQSEKKLWLARIKPKRIWFILLGFVGILIVISLIYYRHNLNNTPHHDIKFNCVNPIGHSPHSAIFKLRSGSGRTITLSDYSIDFKNWRRGKAQWTDSTISCYYEKPGVYYPKLYHKNTVIDSSQVVLLSEGWEVTAQSEQDTLRLYPILKGSKNLKNPPLVSVHDIYNSGIDIMKTFFVNFSYIQPDERISADNICIEADIQASGSRPGVRCSQADLTVYGSKNAHYFSLIKPECISWSYYKFGEITKSGKNDDLSDFGHDMVTKRRLRLEINQQQVFIYLDGQKIFTTVYKNAIGHFMGINIMFAGVGKVSDIKIAPIP